MKEEPVLSFAKEKTNRLLWGLIFFSFATHALVLGNIKGLYSRDVGYIELEMRNELSPSGRTIPEPPNAHKKNRVSCDASQVKEVYVPENRPIPSLTGPQEILSGPEGIRNETSAPALKISRPEIFDIGSMGSYSIAETGNANSMAGDYYDIIRMIIEDKKEYPQRARDRHIEGSVLVNFTVAPDGTASDISLARSSQHLILDRAALAAVKASSPFPPPPDGPLSIEVNILFELI